MNIAFYNPSHLSYQSGPEIWLYDMANRFAKKGHGVSILQTDLNRTDDSPVGNLHKKIRFITIKSYKIPVLNLMLPVGLFDYIDPYETVYFFSGYAVHDIFSYLFARFCKSQYVYGVMGPRYTRYFLHNVYQTLVANVIIRLSDKVHVLNSIDGNDIRPLNKNIINIPFRPVGIPPRVVYAKKSKKLNVIYTGRLTEQKNIRKLLEVIKSFRNDLKIQFYVAGKGEFEKEVIAYARKYANLRYLGHIPQHKLSAIYKDKHIFLNLSEYETYGSAMAEGLANGLVLISSDVGFVRELGKLPVYKVEKRNSVLSASRALYKLKQIYFSEFPRFRNLSKQSRSLIVQRYSHENTCDNILSLLERNQMTGANDKLMKDPLYLDKLKRLIRNKNVSDYLAYMVDYLFVKTRNSKIKTIMDVGCGTGYISSLFIRKFKKTKVLSVDYSRQNLEFGVKTGLIQNPIYSSIYDLEKVARKKKFKKIDLIFLGDVIEHLDNVNAALSNIYHVLSRNGFFVIHTPNKSYTSFFRTPPDPAHFHEFQRNEIADLLESKGFKVLSLFPSGIPVLNKINPGLAQKISYSSYLEFIFRKIDILGPSMFIISKK